MGSGGIAPRILNLGTRWRWVVSFTPSPLYPQRKSLWYSMDRRLGGPQSWPGHGVEEKNSQPPPEIEPPIIHYFSQEVFCSSLILGTKTPESFPPYLL
jgi:hypothetical protein